MAGLASTIFPFTGYIIQKQGVSGQKYNNRFNSKQHQKYKIPRNKLEKQIYKKETVKFCYHNEDFNKWENAVFLDG